MELSSKLSDDDIPLKYFTALLLHYILLHIVMFYIFLLKYSTYYTRYYVILQFTMFYYDLLWFFMLFGLLHFESAIIPTTFSVQVLLRNKGSFPLTRYKIWYVGTTLKSCSECCHRKCRGVVPETGWHLMLYLLITDWPYTIDEIFISRFLIDCCNSHDLVCFGPIQSIWIPEIGKERRGQWWRIQFNELYMVYNRVVPTTRSRLYTKRSIRSHFICCILVLCHHYRVNLHSQSCRLLHKYVHYRPHSYTA